MKKTAFALCLGLAACGGATDTDPHAVTKCEAMVRSICARNLECHPIMGSSVSACVTEFYNGLDNGNGCTQAVAVSATYDDCMTGLPSWSCSQLDAGVIPPACMHVILWKR